MKLQLGLGMLMAFLGAIGGGLALFSDFLVELSVPRLVGDIAYLAAPVFGAMGLGLVLGAVSAYVIGPRISGVLMALAITMLLSVAVVFPPHMPEVTMSGIGNAVFRFDPVVTMKTFMTWFILGALLPTHRKIRKLDGSAQAPSVQPAPPRRPRRDEKD